MNIKKEIYDDVCIFFLNGRLDSNTSPAFESALLQIIEDGFRRIAVDFDLLEYISSAGLRVILKATKDLQKLKGELVLCAMQDYVREVFEIAGFDTFLSIVSSFADVKKKYGIEF